MPAATGLIGVLKDSSIEVESVDYANQLNRFRLVPDNPSQTRRVLVPDGAITDVDSTVWTLEVAGEQKYTTGGFAKLMNDSDPGTEFDVVWQPVAGVIGQPEVTFTFKSKPVNVGGDQGAAGLFETVYDVVGQPVFGDISA